MAKKRKLWIKGVKTKRHAPAGLFAHGSAQKIASWAKRGVGKAQAVRAINFYLNRAGRNLKRGRRQVIKQALNLVRRKRLRRRSK